MRDRTIGVLACCLLSLCAAGAMPEDEEFPVLKGPFLGQEPPGESPVAFAPSIISCTGAIHGCLAFTPDGTEIYWIFIPADYGERPPAINYIKQVDGRWTKPGILESSREYEAGTLNISPDGKRMFFGSRRLWPDSWGERPPANSLEANKVWSVERAGTGWGEPKPLDRRINQNIGGVSSTMDGTLYAHGIKRVRVKKGRYTDWEELGPPLDVGRIPGGTPFISPDESYILFNGRWPGHDGSGRFVSYRTGDDRWTEPVNVLARINAPRGGSQPLVTPDGKYLFYYTGGKFYWMDAKVIEDLKPNELRSDKTMKPPASGNGPERESPPKEKST